MLLAALSLAMAVLCAAVWTADFRRRRRLDAPPRCGGCAHLLAPGQMQCPECGRAWTDSDPGAARVFGRVADRCERLRRASIVASAALGVAALVCATLGGLYIAGTLPVGYATNAWWYAPVETRGEGQEWTDTDSELWVQVQGVRLDPDGFVAGGPMDRVDEVRIVRVLREPRTEPAVGLGSEFQGGLGLRLMVADNEVTACHRWSMDKPWSGPDGPHKLEDLNAQYAGMLSWWLGPHRFGPASPELRQAWDRKLCDLAVDLCKGQDVRAHVRWGEQGTSFMPQDVAHRSASRLQQLAIAALVGCTSIAVAATALARAVLGSRASAPRPRRAASSSS